MTRIVFLLTAAACLSALLACSDGDANGGPGSPPPVNDSGITPISPVPRPASVPETAIRIEQTTSLGRIARRAEEPPQTSMTRELLDATCSDDVVVLETSEETIYTAVSCDGFWDAEAAALYVGETVAIVLEITELRARVLIETLPGAIAQFSVGGIWIE